MSGGCGAILQYLPAPRALATRAMPKQRASGKAPAASLEERAELLTTADQGAQSTGCPRGQKRLA
eukprot:12468336-Alexandrium_andersonii.AAC.1